MTLVQVRSSRSVPTLRSTYALRIRLQKDIRDTVMVCMQPLRLPVGGLHSTTTPHPKKQQSEKKRTVMLGPPGLPREDTWSSHFGNHRDLILKGLERLATANLGLAAPDKRSCIALAVQFLPRTRRMRMGVPLWPKEPDN